jgi:hypothetical protein
MHAMPHRSALSALALLSLAAACGKATLTQNAAGSLPQSVTVTVEPPSAALPAGGTQVFAAAVTGTADTGVTWSIQEGAPGGQVTAGGAYTAPATAGTFHVVATSSADPQRQGSATITVSAPPPAVTVAITPGATAAFGCQTVTFSASVTGTANQAVAWSVVEAGGGTISVAGLYTAPSAPGTYHVMAASGTSSATSAVTVTTKVLSVTVAPTTITVPEGGTTQLTATVTTTCGSAVAARTVAADGLAN